MTDKHFNAILAKNAIAKELGQVDLHTDCGGINPLFILMQLKEIEAYIGQGNQPSVEDIIND